jgi:oxygen-independent coproporphyrinogen-3 oxidase
LESADTLVQKYNVAAPRYTSYPTVPYWDNETFTYDAWKSRVKNSFDISNGKDGISIYIHMPFCESLCTYCGCNTRITINHKVEAPYIEAVLAEWDLYKKLFNGIPKIKQLHLGGGTPTFFTPENLKKLVDDLLTGCTFADEIDFSFEAHPNNTTRHHLFTLYQLGFRRISLGVQDFDRRVQTMVNRIQSYESVKQVTEQAREIGYTSVNYDLIYGLPLQTANSITDTINKVVILHPDRIAFYNYAHVPWIKPGQRKFTEADLPEGEAKLNLYKLGKTLLERNDYVEIGMDHFALKEDELFKSMIRGELHRNFMGYTVGYTRLMIGLGVSSISDSWDGFAQNVKTVESYQKSILEKKIPVYRGHLLNQKDEYFRKIILQLMCCFKSEIDADFPGAGEAIFRLTEMEEDGLCEIHGRTILITKKGRSFVRNICMAFDQRLWQNQPATTIFSNAI